MAATGIRAAILCCVFVVALTIPSYTTSAQRMIGRGYDRMDEVPQDVVAEPRKRPFCNAFTGCGRKRSSPPAQQMMLQEQLKSNLRKLPIDDSLESLLDLSSEPAVEELSRQILSEAKLWEAIQEASAELRSRRQPGYGAVATQ